MTRDELRENVRCSLFDEQDTDAVMADVDRYVKALLQQTPCTAPLPSDDELFEIVEKILFEQTSSDPMTECVNKMNLLRQFINDKCL